MMNNRESKPTQQFINCINSKDHDIGCECVICRSCRDEILIFYKNKQKKRYASKSFDDTIIRSKPILIPTAKNKEKNDLANSLPNIYYTLNKKITIIT